jgi:DeoR/GlpR family transcriptional regulator of sugar metabolism
MIQEAHPALAPERRDRIRNLVREGGVARVEDLRKNLKVSVATIRRDLEILEEEGKVKRVHGGAVSMESRLEESVFDDKTNLARQTEKENCRRCTHPGWAMRNPFFWTGEAPLYFLRGF